MGSFKLVQKVELFECCKEGRFLHICSVSRNLECTLNTTEADEVKFDLCNVNYFSWGLREGCAV